MSTDTVATVENWHGTSTGYAYGCRCTACTAANAARARDYYARKLSGTPVTAQRKAQLAEFRRRRIERGLPDPNDSRHGTRNGYVDYGCKCDECRRAITAYRRRNRNAQRNQGKQ